VRVWKVGKKVWKSEKLKVKEAEVEKEVGGNSRRVVG